MDNFEVKDFRLLNRDDNYDLKYLYWSRIYEYPIVKEYLEKYGVNRGS